MTNLRIKNPERIIIGHININSLRNKFEFLADMIKDKLDILMVSETKLDSSFPEAQFYINGYSKPYRRDRNENGGGIMLYIKEGIPSKLLKPLSNEKDKEYFLVEINLRKKKWLLICNYNPQKKLIKEHLACVTKEIDSQSSNYDNILLLGDFNSEPTEETMENFCQIHNLKNLVHDPTCFKNPENPTMIDLFLTNKPRCFQNSITFETGLSDFHKMTITVLKMFFQKQSPKIITYRDYKTYDKNRFQEQLLHQFEKKSPEERKLENLQKICLSVLNNFAPKKRKTIRANHAPFVNKKLQQAIMVRSKLRNKFLKTRSVSDRKAYNRQRNACVKLLRDSKKEYFSNLNTKNVTDNRKFWKSVKTCFSDKSNSFENITLVENGEVVSNDKEVAKIFSEYFDTLVSNLNLKVPNNTLTPNENIDDPILAAICKYQNHPSIKIIKEKHCNDKFSFSNVTIDCIKSEIKNLNTQKATQESDIPTKIIKEHIDIFSQFLNQTVNNTINFSDYPSNLKNADVTPAYKKDSRNDKSNYRPISILPNLSKIYENILNKQMTLYFEKKFSKYQTGFRKGLSAQNCLISMIEKFRKCLDQKGDYAALLTDLSKAFDCLPHDLIIAKLHAYGFDKPSLKLIHSYLSGRYQRVKINNTYSSYKLIKHGVPQGSILGPLLFNIFLCDMFLLLHETDIASYADDNTPYTTGKSPSEVLNELKSAASKIFDWFNNNAMKANQDKCHLLSSLDPETSISLEMCDIKNTKSQKLLGVTIDKKLTFEEHVSKLCEKASRKINALARVFPFMTLGQRRTLMNAYFISQFNYCSLVWMNHSRSLNNRINNLHERALRLVHKDFSSTFPELLEKDNSVSIHQRNLQNLALEMFKVKNNLAPEIMSELFVSNKLHYNLRKNTDFKHASARTVLYGTETVSVLGPKVWNLLPVDLKNSSSIIEFKRKIRSWSTKNCPCRLCKKYLPNLGFI